MHGISTIRTHILMEKHGDVKESLQGAANLSDLYLNKNGGELVQCEESLNDGYAVHAPVGTFLPNAFGLHDVQGNVWEWCEDIYAPSYKNTPVDGSANRGDSSGRIYRGGGWSSNAFRCRSANRIGVDVGLREYYLGLRPAAFCP